MAKIEVGAVFLTRLIFHDLNLEIVGVELVRTPYGVQLLRFEVEGSDVPDCEIAVCEITERSTKARLVPRDETQEMRNEIIEA